MTTQIAIIARKLVTLKASPLFTPAMCEDLDLTIRQSLLCDVISGVSYSLDRSRADKVVLGVSAKGAFYTMIVRPMFDGLHLSVHGPNHAGLKDVVTRLMHERLMSEVTL